MNLSKKTLSILLSLFFVVPFPLLTAGRAHAQTPRVYLDPTPLTLGQVGATGTFGVRLGEVGSLSAFEVSLSYDSSKVRVDAVEIPPAVSGSRVGPAIDNETGEVSFGAWTSNRVGGGNFDFVNIVAGQESPVLLATISLTAVGEGSAPVSFVEGDTSMFGTEAVEYGDPPPIDVNTEGGLVQVGAPAGTVINLSSGGNRVIWPSGLSDLTSLSALESITTDCGSAGAVSRKKGGWWESAVYGYGGADFGLRPNASYYIKVASSCSWTP